MKTDLVVETNKLNMSRYKHTYEIGSHGSMLVAGTFEANNEPIQYCVAFDFLGEKIVVAKTSSCEQSVHLKEQGQAWGLWKTTWLSHYRLTLIATLMEIFNNKSSIHDKIMNTKREILLNRAEEHGRKSVNAQKNIQNYYPRIDDKNPTGPAQFQMVDGLTYVGWILLNEDGLGFHGIARCGRTLGIDEESRHWRTGKWVKL